MTGVHELPGGFTVTFRFRQTALETEWRPRLPTATEFAEMLRSYRNARAQFLGYVGCSVLVIER